MVTLSKKICLLGDFAVGKTSLVRRFVYDLFDDKYISTIGVKVSRKVIRVPRESEIVNLTMMLWDLAGSEEFDEVRASYMRGTAGAILVCDLTRSTTLDSLLAYADDLLSLNPDTKLVLAVNKSDLLGQRKITDARIDAVAGKLGVACHMTSAKNGDEVEAIFHHLGLLLVT